MSEHTYRIVEIVGTSPESTDAAIRNGLVRANQTLSGLDWFEVQSVRGGLENGEVAHFHVTLKVVFGSRNPRTESSRRSPSRDGDEKIRSPFRRACVQTLPR